MVDPMASNFLNEATLSDRFFSLLVFLHIGIPLALLLGMFIHIKRISGARSNPARGLAAGTLLAMLAVSLWRPALSQAPANLDIAVTEVGLDWIFLNTFPLINSWGPGPVWGLLVGLSTLLALVPWLPSKRPKQTPVAVVDPDNCNGCGWCVADCPYEAVSMKVHDYKTGHRQSVVDPNLCISCGICAGACPSSSPFRHVDELTTGISIPGFHIKELLSLTEKKLQELDTDAPRIMLYGCDHGSVIEALGSRSVASISMPCTALVPPAFVDYVLRKNLAEGVMISGCCAGDCHYRLGNTWMDQRFNMERMPVLRARVPRDKVRLRWLGEQGTAQLQREVAAFQVQLQQDGPLHLAEADNG
jgi:ferredoxin/coenzyme F420-reducing hydrogenase delta subunit